MAHSIRLPQGVTVLERGWLSANNVLISGDGPSALIDSGYCTHERQTLELVAFGLQGRPLDLLLNTHLHSDHCGGNAALQERYPDARTLIPPGQADAVRRWDPIALTFEPTGQLCPRFRADGLLLPGESIKLGDLRWEIHAAPGHDAHSVVLFEPVTRTLISADALWQNGFGVVFPELEGDDAFAAVGRTLDLIEDLNPSVIIPGHGAIFQDLSGALAAARRRLERFQNDPASHARHAAKVLLKFKLLERQRIAWSELHSWVASTPYFRTVWAGWFASAPIERWLNDLVEDLERSGAARASGAFVLNC